MFFDNLLLCRQSGGKFAIIWIAATRGIKYISNKQIQDTDIEKICDDIVTMLTTQSQIPKVRLSLTLAAKLINGTIKIFYQKTLLLQNSLIEYLLLVHARPSKPEREEKKARKRKPVLSDEVNRPIAGVIEDIAPELHITDRDVEKALLGVPSVPIESITLRDEISRRTMPLEEEGGFGDEGFALELQPPIAEADKQKVLRTLSPSAKQILDTIEVTDVMEALRSEAVFGKPESLQAIEVQLHETPTKRKLRKDTEKDLPVRQEESVEQQLGTPKKRKLARRIEEEFVVREETPVPKRVPTKSTKVFVKSRKQPTRKLMRYDLQEEAIAEIFGDTFDLTMDVSIFENVHEEWEEILQMSLTGDFIDRVRAQESRGSRITGSLGSLRKSRETTPITAMRSQRDTVQPSGHLGSIGENATVETPIASEIPLPQVEGVQMPEVDMPQIPMEHVVTPMGVLLEERESIIEEVPTIRKSPVQEQDLPGRSPNARESIIEEVPTIRKSPVQEQDLPGRSPNARHQEIIRIVKTWDFEARDLTIEDVCIRPVNRVNVALAFFDLLCLHKLQIVTLKKKQDSLELEKILKGPKFQEI